MSRTAVLAVRIVTETKEANKGIDETASRLDKFERGLDKATVPAAAAGAAVLAFAKKTGEMASIAQQNAGAVDSVFKGNAASVNAFAATAADKLGLSASSYQQMASVIGSQLKNMGVPMDQVADSTNGLIEKGADLAAMFGGSTSDAVSALSSLLRGERDPIERYGVSINQAAIDAKKAELGLAGLSGEADKNATLTATMALLQKQTADATGQFAREADSAAGAQERANAKIQDAGAKLGSVFLPAMAAAAAAAGGMATWASENSTVLLILIGVIGGLAGAILAVNGALKAWRAATAALAAVQVVLNAVMAANPIGLVVLAIAALVAGLVWAYNNVGWFKDFVDTAFAAVSAAVQAAAKWFGDAWNNAVNYVKTVVLVWVAIVTGAYNAVRAGAAAAGAWFQSVWQGAVNFVLGIVRGFQNGAVAAVNAVRAGAAAAGAGFQSVWQGAVNFVLGTVQRGADLIRGAFAGALQFAASVGQSAFAGITGAIQNVIGWIQNALSWVRSLTSGIAGAAGRLLGFGGATGAAPDAGGYGFDPGHGFGGPGGATGGMLSPSIFSAPRPTTAGAAAPVINVTVNGALDPVAVGAQIDEILRKHLRRSGQLVNGATPW